MDKKRELLWRAYLVMVMFALITLVIMFKIFKISVIEGDKWTKKAQDNVKWKVVDADRGSIYSDEMNLMSTSVQFFEVRMDLTVIKEADFVKNVDSLSIFLSQFQPDLIKPKSAAQWKADLIAQRKKGNKYYFIAKGLDVEAFNKLKKAPLFRLGKNRGGFIRSRYGKRVKPYKDMASRTIGVDRDNADKIGIEGYFDRFLKGNSDQRLMKRLLQKNDDDIWVPVFDPSENEIKVGDDVVTTINIELQDITHHSLMEYLQKYNAEGGLAVIMEVNTGAIKAIANLSKTADGNYMEAYNHAVARLSEPGSTMKLATVLALMEDKYATPETQVNLNYGQKKFSDRIMHDSEKHGKTIVTMSEAFEISSNVGIASLANDAYNSIDGRKKWYQRMVGFGFSEPTGVDLIGEAIPMLKNPKNKDTWYGTTIPWMAHGYELLNTPLQMLTFYNGVANDGKMMKPFLVSEIRKGEQVKKFEPLVLNPQLASAENIQHAQKMLENVVLKGTGKNLKSEYLTIAGKTGTSRVNYANQAEYAKYNASFCGYFPADKPVYSAIVVVYEPKGVYYGGYVAGPVFKNIAEKAYGLKTQTTRSLSDSSFVNNHKLPGRGQGFNKDFKEVFDYVGLHFQDKAKADWVKVEPFETTMLLGEKKVSKGIIPDCRGMGARDAAFLLESMGLSVRFEGAGKVVRQSVVPGTKASSQYITIYLN